MKKLILKIVRDINGFILTFTLFILLSNCASPLRMTGIHKIDSIQINPKILPSTQTKTDLNLNVDIHVEGGIPNEYNDILAKKVESSLVNSIRSLNLFQNVIVKSHRMEDINLLVKFSYAHRAYDDLQYLPLAVLTVFLITPSHVDTQGTAEVSINSPFVKEIYQEKFHYAASGYTPTGLKGYGDAAAKAIEVVSSGMIEKITEFVLNKQSFCQNIILAKREAEAIEPNNEKIKIVSFKTKELPRPDIQVVKIDVEDRSGNGKIEPAEIVGIIFKMQNKGKGIAKSVNVKIKPGNDVFLLAKRELFIGDIESGGAKDVNFSFYTRKKTPEIIITIELFETGGSKFNKAETLRLEFNRQYGTSKDIVILGLGDIENLLKGGVSSKRIAALINKLGISFIATEENLDILRSAGADETVVEAIRRESPEDKFTETDEPTKKTVEDRLKPYREQEQYL